MGLWLQADIIRPRFPEKAQTHCNGLQSCENDFETERLGVSAASGSRLAHPWSQVNLRNMD
jgi:hypothetical protein